MANIFKSNNLKMFLNGFRLKSKVFEKCQLFQVSYTNDRLDILLSTQHFTHCRGFINVGGKERRSGVTESMGPHPVQQNNREWKHCNLGSCKL